MLFAAGICRAINRGKTVKSTLMTFDIESWLAPLPALYRAFLEANENDIAFGDVLLYGRSSFIERNTTWEVKTYWPTVTAIGDNGGGQAFVIDHATGRVSMVDVGGMTEEISDPVADDFSHWLSAGCPIPRKPQPRWSPLEPVLVCIEKKPASLSTLLQIKEALGANESIANLKRGLDSLPCVVTQQLTYAQAIIGCAKVNARDRCLGIRLKINPQVPLPTEWE